MRSALARARVLKEFVDSKDEDSAQPEAARALAGVDGAQKEEIGFSFDGRSTGPSTLLQNSAQPVAPSVQKGAAPTALSTRGAAVGRQERPSDASVSQESASVKSVKSANARLSQRTRSAQSAKSASLPTWMEARVSDANSLKMPGAVEYLDLSNALLLASDYGQDIRYCEEWGKWISWTGKRWQPGKRSAATRAAAKLAFDAHLKELAVELPKDVEKDSPEFKKAVETRKERLSATRAMQSSSRIKSMIDLASQTSMLEIHPEDFDTDPWKFNATNGTIDLRTGEIYAHTRSNFMAKMSGTGSDKDRMYGDYFPTQTDEDCPQWIQFIKTVTCGDAELANYLQRVVGYCMTGDVSERALFIFYGLGSNGKGTFLRVLQSVLGDYAQPAPAGMLEENHSDDHPSRIASLHGTRLAICAEVEKGRRLNESLVKDLTGGDRLAARRMREDFWYFYPTHKLILQGNYKPIISGEDFGIWSRVHIVPWNATFKDDSENQVRNFSEKLLPEAAAILAWCVRGCLMWQQKGLKRPAAVEAETKKFMREMNHLREYAMERFYRSYGSMISREDIRDDYEVWATKRNLPLIDLRDFIPKLRQILLEEFAAIDTKGRLEGHPYPVRVWKHVNFRSPGEVPIVPSLNGQNYDT